MNAADGLITLAEGCFATGNNAGRCNDATTKAAVKTFFEPDAEICAAISSNVQNMAVGYFVSFSKSNAE